MCEVHKSPSNTHKTRKRFHPGSSDISHRRHHILYPEVPGAVVFSGVIISYTQVYLSSPHCTAGAIVWVKKKLSKDKGLQDIFYKRLNRQNRQHQRCSVRLSEALPSSLPRKSASAHTASSGRWTAPGAFVRAQYFGSCSHAFLRTQHSAHTLGENGLLLPHLQRQK